MAGLNFRFQLPAFSEDVPQRLEGVEDGGDLIGALLELAPETRGEGVGIWADGGQQLAQGGHLRGQFRRPIGERLWIMDCGLWISRGVVAQADLGLVGGGRGGGLEVRAQPADQAALFFGRAFVVERDEAGEDELFEGFGSGSATGEGVGG